MEPPHPRRWHVWALAGALALGAGGLTARPALAKPGFGTVSDDDRAKQKAEREKRAEEQRQQEKARDAQRQADRDRQAQERARQEPGAHPSEAREGRRETERRAQREQAERDHSARDAQRERDRQTEREAQAKAERAAREIQARAERERAAGDAQARADRQRDEPDAQARADRERTERESQERAVRERAAQETAAREARTREGAPPEGWSRRATEGKDPQPERRRPGFGRRSTEEPRRDAMPSTPTQPASEPHGQRPESPTETRRTRPGFGTRSETPRSAETAQPDEMHSQQTGRLGSGSTAPPSQVTPAPALEPPRSRAPHARTPEPSAEGASPRRRPGFGTRPDPTRSRPDVRPQPGDDRGGQTTPSGSPATTNPSIPGRREDSHDAERRGRVPASRRDARGSEAAEKGAASRSSETTKGDERQQRIPFGVRRPDQATRKGSLDRYFNPRGGNIGYRANDGRDRRDRERTAYRYDRRDRQHIAYRHDRRYHYQHYGDCPYDVIYVPPPPPVVVYEPPRTDVVVIPVPVPPAEDRDPDFAREPRAPESEPESSESPSQQLARASTLDEVIADVEEAWLTGNLQLLMQHVRDDRPLEVYREGEFTSALSWEQFRDKTREAFRRYETLAMRFAPPRMLSDTEAVVSAEHRFREPGGEERRVRVVYALTQERGAWWIAGLDYLALQQEAAHPQPRPAAVRARPSGPLLSQVTLVKARSVRWTALLAQGRPALLATLRAVAGGRPELYDLKAMRGIHPGTLAWALYRRGQARPLEVGMLEPRPMRSNAWAAVKIARAAPPVAPMARLTSAGRAGRPGPAVFPIRALGGARLVLIEASLLKRQRSGVNSDVRRLKPWQGRHKVGLRRLPA